MKATKQYESSRYNSKSGILLTTKEYSINGCPITLCVRLCDEIDVWGCMIGRRKDALSEQYVKVCSFDGGFIMKHIDEESRITWSLREFLSGVSTQTICALLEPVFNELLDIAMELVECHELTSNVSSGILETDKDGDSMLLWIEHGK